MFRHFDIIDFLSGCIWTTAKYIFIMLIVASNILYILSLFVEFKYIEPNSQTYHLYEDCKYVNDKDDLRRIKSKEVRKNGYTRCSNCEKKKEYYRQVDQERREENKRQYYPLR